MIRWKKKFAIHRYLGDRARKLYRPYQTSRPFCGVLIDLALENRHCASHPAARWLPLPAIVTNRINFITSVFCFPPQRPPLYFRPVLYSASLPLTEHAPRKSPLFIVSPDAVPSIGRFKCIYWWKINKIVIEMEICTKAISITGLYKWLIMTRDT